MSAEVPGSSGLEVPGWANGPNRREVLSMIRLSARLGILLCLTSVALVTASARAGDSGKCTIATKPDSPTGKACAKGGRSEAKKMMKEMVKVAKANGQKFTCDGCHKDLDDYTLTKNGQDDFKKLVVAQEK
jgi:hypothetical protein